MIVTLKNMTFFILVSVALSACGSSSSSTTSTTVPNYESVFYAHNLVFRNNTSFSTGYNGFGQLGTGNLASTSTPGALNQYYPFAGFATGTNHSVAFFNNSTVRCWGYNGLGQLGNDLTTASSVPVRTVVKSYFKPYSSVNIALSGIKAVAAGGHHTLALKNDDTVWAWGSNDSGQLGVGGAIGYSPFAEKVIGSTGSPFSNISSIAANGKHSLVRANGSVWAWGLNSSGQIGLDPSIGASADPLNLSNTYTALQLGVSAIAAGGGFSYAVRTIDKTVWAWGNNANGQLGDGTIVSSYKPVQVMKSASIPLDNVVQVAAGIQHGLARLANGEVWAWGYNFYGQLGNNGKLDSPYAVKVLDASGSSLAGANDIRAFGSSSMAKVGNVWYAWGDNSFGQLGTGATGNVAVPTRLLGF